MTDSIRVLRGRRPPTFEAVPEQLAQWFAGEITDSFYALLPNEITLLPARWRAWRAEHPRAIPRSGFEWLDDPADPRHPTEAQIREARRMLARDK